MFINSKELRNSLHTFSRDTEYFEVTFRRWALFVFHVTQRKNEKLCRRENKVRESTELKKCIEKVEKGFSYEPSFSRKLSFKMWSAPTAHSPLN